MDILIENVYIVLSLNGIICAMISLFCIIVYCVVTKRNLKECGFNLINIKLSLRLVVLFLVVFMTLYVSIGTIQQEMVYLIISFISN